MLQSLRSAKLLTYSHRALAGSLIDDAFPVSVQEGQSKVQNLKTAALCALAALRARDGDFELPIAHERGYDSAKEGFEDGFLPPQE